ncbi:MAG: hypothetical protein Q8908_13205 [Bacteroidota bacterium]|nr:hypothetical protein [Bacteroidota bacterium]
MELASMISSLVFAIFNHARFITGRFCSTNDSSFLSQGKAKEGNDKESGNDKSVADQ